MEKRPCILVIDREFPGTISSRKLVLETAKFNVITAYSGHEGIETLERFPKVDAAVLDEVYRDMDCLELAPRLKQIVPSLPLIATTSTGQCDCVEVDRAIPSYDPALLLNTLRQLFPAASAEILSHRKKKAQE